MNPIIKLVSILVKNHTAFREFVAVILYRLNIIPERFKGRARARYKTKQYTKELSKLVAIQCPVVQPNVITSQHNYVIRCNERDELHLYLRERNISTGVHYLPLYRHQYYKKFSPEPSLLVTEREWQRFGTLRAIGLSRPTVPVQWN